MSEDIVKAILGKNKANDVIKILSSAELTIPQLKRVLIHIEKAIGNMKTPLLLSDFLTQAYNTGGVISMLALNGLFVLIVKHNLDYRDFYPKLYRLLQPGTLHVKYRARFFHIFDRILSSTHLPSYVVCAFVKRLSRLALWTPAEAQPMILTLISNLIIRHSSCQVLLRRQKPTDYTDDPYVEDEPDLKLCNAQESSLWEIKGLQQHFESTVALKALAFDQELPAMEEEFDDEVLEKTYQDMIENETPIENVAITFKTENFLNDDIGLFWTDG